MMLTCGQCRRIFSLNEPRLLSSSSTSIALSINLICFYPDFDPGTSGNVIFSQVGDYKIRCFGSAIMQLETLDSDLDAVRLMFRSVKGFDLPGSCPAHSVVADKVLNKSVFQPDMD